MNDIITITQQDSENINRFLYSHNEFKNHLQVKPFTIRYPLDNVSILLDASANRQGITIHCREEGSALISKPHLPECEFTISINNGKTRYVKMPKNPEAYKWLTTHNGARTNAESLIYLYIHANVALSHFSQFLKKRVYNDYTDYRIPSDFIERITQYINYATITARKATMLDGWDIVTLTENQYYKVIETNIKHHVEYDVNNIPLPKFCLSIYDGKETDYYFFEKKGKTIRCGVTDPDQFITKFFDVNITGVTAEGIASTLHVDDNEVGLWKWLNEPCGKKTNGEDTDDANWEWCADAFFIINTFMLHFGDVTMDVETKVAQAQTEKHSHKKSKANTVRLFKSYKLVKNWTTQARKKAEFTCPAWGVRGHFRHLRNGKTIFVEAYVKGKDKDQYKGKEYALIPYKDA